MSDSAHCWFDWDDNTTTVNSINIIKEPRKPWRDYNLGESVQAKLPHFGLWRGVIVDISESKQDLVRKMQQRQKLQLELMQTDDDENDNDAITEEVEEEKIGNVGGEKKKKEKATGNNAAEKKGKRKDRRELEEKEEEKKKKEA